MTQTTKETEVTTYQSNEEYTDSLELLLIEKLMPAANALDSDEYSRLLHFFCHDLQQLIANTEYVFAIDQYTSEAATALKEIGHITKNAWDGYTVSIPGMYIVCSETVPDGSLHKIVVTLFTGKKIAYTWYDLEHGDQPGMVELTLV